MISEAIENKAFFFFYTETTMAASISCSKSLSDYRSLPHRNLLISSNLLLSPSSSISFQLCPPHSQLRAVKTGSEPADPYSSAELLRKPVISPEFELSSTDDEGDLEDDDVKKKKSGGGGDEEGWVDWEDQILEDTVPLVGFVRMILHSGKYRSGDRLSPEHQGTILERLLPYHPECEKKIGCGVDYITVGYHPNFEGSRCMFIVRADGELVDFSYWKCIKGLIKKNYPLYADSFILRHFLRHRRNL